MANRPELALTVEGVIQPGWDLLVEGCLAPQEPRSRSYPTTTSPVAPTCGTWMAMSALRRVTQALSRVVFARSCLETAVFRLLLGLLPGARALT